MLFRSWASLCDACADRIDDIRRVRRTVVAEADVLKFVDPRLQAVEGCGTELEPKRAQLDQAELAAIDQAHLIERIAAEKLDALLWLDIGMDAKVQVPAALRLAAVVPGQAFGSRAASTTSLDGLSALLRAEFTISEHLDAGTSRSGCVSRRRGTACALVPVAVAP